MKTNQQLHVEALEALLTTTLKLLHERGILPAGDVSAAAQAHHYSSVAGLEFEANPYLQVYVDQLLLIANVGKQ